MRSSTAGRLSGDSIPICATNPSMEIVPDKWAGRGPPRAAVIPGDAQHRTRNIASPVRNDGS